MATVETVTENVNLNVEESNDTTYRPNELTAVGKVYDQYTAGLNKLQAQSQLKNVEDKSTPQ